ncbi:MAG: glycosyltransferase [Acidobacteria bacterium]|nr:glycosyltransferase [Acidobacteriota bacterium]
MSRRPISVLHVLGSLDRGGVETWLLDLLTHLDRSRWRFDFCTLGPTPGRYASLARARGSRVLPCALGMPKNGVSFAGRLRALLREGEYHVVHSHVHHFSGPVLAIARLAGVPVRVAHSHNTEDGCADGWRRRLYRALSGGLLRAASTHRLACSAEAAAALFSPRWRQDPRVRVLHYGLNGRLAPAPPDPRLRRTLGIPDGVPVVGHVGRFHRQKNHDFLLEVAAALRLLRPEVRWLLAGEGERRQAVEHAARQMGLSNVIFCGLREDIPALMAGAMDAFLLPSLYEGLPVALLEAQAAGLPSLASSRISSEAAAVEGAVEFLPLEAGPRAWAERTLACLDRGRIPPQLARLQLESQGFTIEVSLRELLGGYQSALGRLA